MAMPSLGEAFESFQQEAMRLEGLPIYRVDEETDAWAAFTAGRKPDMSFHEGWLDHVRQVVASDRRHLRIRLLSDPPTDYERFELEHPYPLNVAAGEEVRTLTGATELTDCWIFDRRLVYRMVYDEAGKFLSAEPLSESSAVVAEVYKLWEAGAPLLPHR